MPCCGGLLAAILRFIPYLGPVIAAFFPLVLAIAVDPGWTMFLLTLALIVALELFTNNVLEPWLYGSSTGLSPVAMLVAALFWTSLWGPVGLLLATPLTVCLVVLGRHVPQLQFLDILLGDEPAMPPHARIYQRLLRRRHARGDGGRRGVRRCGGDRKLGDECCSRYCNMPRRIADAVRSIVTADGRARGVEEIAEFSPNRRQAMWSCRAAARMLCAGERTPLDAAAAAVIGRLAERELPAGP